MKKNLVLIVYTSIVLTIGVLFYFLNGYLSHKATVEQLLHREQIIARSGALSIEQFLNDFAVSLMLHSEHGDISQSGLDDFISGWKDTPVEGIAYVDEKGDIKINSNKIKTTNETASVADRDYFKWGLVSKRNEYTIGGPIISRYGNTTGRYVIPVATGVFDSDDNFDGILVAVIDLDAMVKRFSEPLRISDRTMVYLLDSRQNFVFSPSQKLTGANFIGTIEGFTFPGKEAVISNLKAEFESPNKEGKYDLTLPDPSNDWQIGRLLSAYSVVRLPGGDWVLIVTTPVEDANAFMGTIYNNHLAVLVFFILVVLGYAILDVTKVWYAERLSYERGYKKGRGKV